MKKSVIILLSILPSFLASYAQLNSSGLSISKEKSVVHENKPVELFKLTNAQGMCIKVTNFAASLTYVSTPDRDGNFEPVVLGFDSLESYFGKYPKFGNTVGRYANRIRNAELRLNNQVYHLEKNFKGHSVHGGVKGFNQQVFDTDTAYVVKDTAVVVFSYKSPHLEGGFPGTLNLRLAYKLTNRNEVILDYTATTDKATVINLTNHSYFNLTGCKEPVLNHTYMIKADSITELDSISIPTGVVLPVAGTVYDFRSPQSVENRIGKLGKGYDINYKLNNQAGRLELVAEVVEPISGRVLKAYTTEPGVQFYIPGSNMDYLTGHGGRTYGKYYGFCLEMQHFPDSPNHPQFPTTILLPGEVYRQTTIYKFETLSK